MKFTYPGLTDREVEASRAQHGSNAVASRDIETFWDNLLNNLKDPIIIILIAAWSEHSNENPSSDCWKKPREPTVPPHTGLGRVRSPNGFD